MSRIGLLGGSFNPAHGGHRRISLFARHALGLDEVWWLVSPGNPLKSGEGMASLSERFASAVDRAARAPIRVTAIERELGTRYTVDTLAALKRRYPANRFVWLMGSDNLAQFHRWKDWRRIARSLPFAVIARPGYSRAALFNPAMSWLRPYRCAPGQLLDREPPAWSWLSFDPDHRSATAIRAQDADWAAKYDARSLRDQVTHRAIS